jgi:hypothetical protein
MIVRTPVDDDSEGAKGPEESQERRNEDQVSLKRRP